MSLIWPAPDPALVLARQAVQTQLVHQIETDIEHIPLAIAEAHAADPETNRRRLVYFSVSTIRLKPVGVWTVQGMQNRIKSWLRPTVAENTWSQAAPLSPGGIAGLSSPKAGSAIPSSASKPAVPGEILRGVVGSINAGQILAVMGASGSGTNCTNGIQFLYP